MSASHRNQYLGNQNLADICNAARGMLLSLGCIQALRCNSNKCPTGIATQDPGLVRGLVVEEKDKRVANFQMETVRSAADKQARLQQA